MTLQSVLDKITDGSRHILLYDLNGEIILKTIWHIDIPNVYKAKTVYSYQEAGCIVKVGIR